MRESVVLLLIFFTFSCATKSPAPVATEKAPAKDAQSHEFARGEVILAAEMLVKIFDKEMAPLICVENKEEAELLLRTIRPRMDVIEDDLEAMLDHQTEVQELIDTCHQNCTCEYIGDLFREHMVTLTPAQTKALAAKNTKKEINRCLSYAQQTFCGSDLYKALEIEKKDFSFEEGQL